MNESTTLASRVLLAELTKKVRERGLVFWVDSEGQYEAFVDALGQAPLEFPYPVVGFRRSYLELMLALERFGSELEPEHVLVHLPGLNKNTVEQTPVYELYKAGTSFEKNLATLVREAAKGVARPEETEAFLGGPPLTLERADEWLAALRSPARDELGVLLDALGLDDVVLGLLGSAPRLLRHLPAGSTRVLDFLRRGLGITGGWRTFVLGEGELSIAGLVSLVSRWLMAVEFVHDLKEPPRAPELQALAKLGPFEKECRRLVARCRAELPDVYEELSLEFQDHLGGERHAHGPQALGSIDTFSFEEAATREAALAALARSDWNAAHAFATDRTPAKCFWVQRDPKLGRTWEVIQLAAEVGRELVAQTGALAGCALLEEAVDRYVERLAEVDRRHRVFEQRARAVLSSDLSDFGALLEVLRTVRQGYRAWADATNRAFHALCVSRGPLPSASYRQRSVFEQVVQPCLEQGGKTAFFLVDALRFEMAQGLCEELKHEKYTVSLKGRLAELPTETRIGMNALAPVAQNGRLRLAFSGDKLIGLRAGEYVVSEPGDRVRCMRERGLGTGADDLELEEFHELDLGALKRRLSPQASLVVVRSRELDTAGEHGLHLATFEGTLALLKSALSLLRQAGVERFVIASDHGFLLQDGSSEAVPFPGGEPAGRRHALLSQRSGASNADVLEVGFADLEYEADKEQYLLFRADTLVWSQQARPAPFVHGGNSLQERVIPVLVVEHAVRRGKTASKYEVIARAEPAELGRQRLRVQVRLQEQSTVPLGIHAAKAITLALRIPGRPDIALRLLDVTPPAVLEAGRLRLPPNRDEALVEFELEGEVDEKVQVEIFHPDEVEDVKSKLVEGFFDVRRPRRTKPRSVPPEARRSSTPPPSRRSVAVSRPDATPSWRELIEDEGYRRVFCIIEERRSINEDELTTVLGSSRRVRFFARQFDQLVTRVPFEVEIRTVAGMKTYARKD
ncbi:MAG: hypothetical protein RL685_587 [Pseudomonadota bacterium]